MRPSLVARAPTRLDFGGGWTDVPPYPEERGGFVCNLAIERRATVRLSHIDDVQQGAGPGGDASALVRLACSEASVRDAHVALSSDFPVGAGLGGSSAAGVALAAALARWNGTSMHPSQLAEWSRAVEVSGLRMAGGRQDHYAAAHGGALALTFGQQVEVKRLALTSQTCANLERQLLLIHTGESRISGETITAVLDAYQSRTPRVVDALLQMKLLAAEMAVSLEAGDVDALGRLIDEHWVHQRALHPRITTGRIDAIHHAAKGAGALGLKALGASGGGCVLIVAPEGRTEAIAKAVQGLGERLSWSIAHTGVETHVETHEAPPLPNDRRTR